MLDDGLEASAAPEDTIDLRGRSDVLDVSTGLDESGDDELWSSPPDLDI